MKAGSGEERKVTARSKSLAEARDFRRATNELATRIMGWRTAPDRFIKTNRSWVPRWRFQPFADVGSSFELLDQAADRYAITCERGAFSVEVHVGTQWGRASGDCLARTIAYAVAEASGVETPS